MVESLGVEVEKLEVQSILAELFFLPVVTMLL